MNSWWRQFEYVPLYGNRAPNERHLEDWIVNNPERFGTHCEQDDYIPDGFISLGKIIGRQVKLPSGIADLIIERDESIVIVELKAGPIKSDTIAQVLRYMKDMREIWYWTFCNHCLENNDTRAMYVYETTNIYAVENGHSPEIIGMIIGNTMHDPNLNIACEMAHIEPYVYRYAENAYRFYSSVDEIAGGSKIIQPGNRHRYEDEFLGDAIKRIMKKRADEEKRVIAHHAWLDTKQEREDNQS